MDSAYPAGSRIIVVIVNSVVITQKSSVQYGEIGKCLVVGPDSLYHLDKDPKLFRTEDAGFLGSS
jgi:hypothetical protein